MESRAGKSGGVENPRKTRSLDLDSLYKSSDSRKEGNSRGKSGGEDDDDDRKKKRKSRKEVSLSSFELAGKKSRISADEIHTGGTSSGSPESGRLQLGHNQELDNNGGFNSISLNLDGDGNLIQIPKRRRDFVGRKKFKSNQVSKSAGQSSSGASGSVDQIAKLNGECKKLEANESQERLLNYDGKASSMDQIAKLRGDPSGKTVSPKVKGELGLDESKKSRTRMGNSARQGKEENGHLIVSHGDSSSKKCHSNRRKRKDLASGDKGIANKVEPMVDSSVKTHGDFQEEDEENLEQNAARMLSSRFDPSCTGFSSKSKSPGSPSTNGLSFFIPSNENFVGRGVNSLARLESASVDTASRVLRPRNGHREKGLLRKRRHFYEILPRDLDAYWVLNRRIKVFWPLDESWYYGLVSDYDPERKLHHIKYDDRDEEWINLQSERFKLLLLPGEVPCRTEQKRATVGNKQDDKEKSDLTTDDDSFMGGCTDSEPIISWLARSSLRIKSSPLGVSKRRKISHLSPNFVSYKLSTRTDEAHGSMDVGPSENDIKKPPCSSALSDRSTDACGGKKFLQEGTNISKDCKFPVVYFRRRFRKKDEALCKAHMDNHAHGSLSVSVTSLASVVQGSQGSREYGISIGRVEPEGLLWSLDVSGSLRLNIPLVISKQFRYELVSLPLLWYRFGLENSWLLRALLFLQHGTLMTTWPMVQLEILFVDNNVGLRLLLFEGDLKQAVAFVFLVLTLFGQPIERGKYVDTQMPVTSIRFGLSSVEDHRKHRVFAFYSFSKVKFSKWLYLDHKLQRHCLLTRKLHLSECTYDNIKTLVCSTGSQCSEFEVLQKSMGTEPIGLLRDSHGAAMNQASSDSYVKHGILIPFALSFGAAPTFFINLHLKLLMENVASISFGDHDSTCSLENSEKSTCPVVDDCTQIQVDSESVSEMTPEGNPGNSVMGAASSESLPSAKSQLGTEILSEFNDGGHAQDFQNGSLNVAGTSTCSSNPGDYVMVQSQKRECSSEELEQQVVASPKPVVPNGHTSLGISDTRSYSGLSIEIPLLDQIERPAGGEMPCAPESADRAWYVRDRFVHGPNPTGPRSMWHRNRNSSSSPMGSISHGWPDGQAEYLRNGFGNGPKRPRTQVQYTLPFGGVDVNSKHKIHNQRGLPYQRIRKANEKRPSDVSRNAHRNLELLVCDANILITTGDRGWREHGARVVLELADHNEWRLAVKLSGTTKYSYKAYQFLQPGSTNRYTHAMMWKGGKDWVLEFPDRSQWMLFKEMHEECYNRNIRAASVKNIPIPGVRLVEETDDSGTEVPLVRSSPKYFRQVETDVDMALNPSCVLYDMDSDDERWISENQECSPGQEKEISENLFEKTMDMFEKLAYARQCDHFTTDEIEELMVGLGPMEAIEVIYQYWQLKRQRNGMPLIRHLQPPLWERYELQLKEWEQKMAKANSAIFNGCHEKALLLDKPPMFAFCLKPRGLEVPNKGSKQRSQRRFPTSGHSHTVLGDQDGSHAFGRRLNGFSFGDEKVLHGTSYDSSEASPLFQASGRVFSPREASGSGHFSLSNDWSEWNHHPKLHRNKSKKIGAFLSPNNAQTVALYNQRSVGKRNGVHWWNMGLPEWPSQKHYQSEGSLRHGIEQLDSSDLDEFRLRDASGAAQHALNMAKLKREKAQRLVYRADLAIHKAVVTLMTAEAIKAAFENSKE